MPWKPSEAIVWQANPEQKNDGMLKKTRIVNELPRNHLFRRKYVTGRISVKSFPRCKRCLHENKHGDPPRILSVIFWSKYLTFVRFGILPTPTWVVWINSILHLQQFLFDLDVMLPSWVYIGCVGTRFSCSKCDMDTLVAGGHMCGRWREPALQEDEAARGERHARLHRAHYAHHG